MQVPSASIPGSGRIAWRRAWQPLQCSCLENPVNRGAWWGYSQRFAESDMTEATQHTCTSLQLQEMDTHGYRNWVCTVQPTLSSPLPTTNWPLPSFTRIKSCAAAPAGFQYLPERSSGWRAEIRHSMLWENWQDRSSGRYFRESIS